jgi:hypothetical protein
MHTNHRNDARNKGLGAAWKVGAVVCAVALLALVAGKPVDLAKDGPGASGTYTMHEPARDIVPLVGVDVPLRSMDGPQLKDDAPGALRMLATAPTANYAPGAPRMLATEPPASEAPGPKPDVAQDPQATAEQPVATF